MTDNVNNTKKNITASEFHLYGCDQVTLVLCVQRCLCYQYSPFIQLQ